MSAVLPTVTIGGVDYTGDTVGDLTIVRGRDTVYLTPSAGYARITLVDFAGFGLPIDIAETVTVTVKDSTGTDITVFVGYLTDISTDLLDAGVGQRPAAAYELYAVGPLARLSRRLIFEDGRPEETDGTRIRDAIADGLSTRWDEAGGTWDDTEPTLTWEDYDPGVDPTIIDTGVFDLAALPASDSGRTALEVISEASSSGEGLLYETLDGFVGWDNADARGAAGTPLTIPASAINAAGLRTLSSVSDLANRVTVSWAGGAETAQDDTSLLTYTLYEREISTILADATNAADRAETYVERHAYPTINLDSVVVRLDTLDDPTLADALLVARTSTSVLLTGLPATLGVTSLDGFVEGTQLRVDRFRAELRLSVSDAALSYFSVRFSGAPPSLTWDDVDATLTWQDARSL